MKKKTVPTLVLTVPIVDKFTYLTFHESNIEISDLLPNKHDT